VVHTPASLLTNCNICRRRRSFPSPPPFFFLCVSVGDHCLFELLLKCSFGFRLYIKFVPLFTRFLEWVELGVLRRKNKAVFVSFFWSSGEYDTFNNGSSWGLFRAFRRIQPFAGLHIRLTLWSKLTSKVRFCLCLSVSLSLCLYGSMIFLLLFIAIISSFVRSLSDFNRVGIHWQLGHPKRQGIRSW
jgi:hypothetical protein